MGLPTLSLQRVQAAVVRLEFCEADASCIARFMLTAQGNKGVSCLAYKERINYSA